MKVWVESKALAKSVYEISKHPHFSKDGGLRDQIRHASISIVSNIAEGAESQSNSSFCRFLYIARASAAEVRAQLYLALDLKYITEAECVQLITQTKSIARQITGFISYLQNSSISAKKNCESRIEN